MVARTSGRIGVLRSAANSPRVGGFRPETLALGVSVSEPAGLAAVLRGLREYGPATLIEASRWSAHGWAPAARRSCRRPIERGRSNASSKTTTPGRPPSRAVGRTADQKSPAYSNPRDIQAGSAFLRSGNRPHKQS